MTNIKNFKILKVCLLSFIYFWISAPFAFAQEPSRWEVGLDALYLIDQNELPGYSLFGRYLLNPKDEKKTQLRMRIGFERFELLDSAFWYGSDEIDQNTSAFFALAGLQRDLKVFSKGTLYTAGDLGFSIAREYLAWGPSRPSAREGYARFEESTIRISGILGYTHQLGRNFSLSVESSLQGVRSLQITDVNFIELQSVDQFTQILENERVENWDIGIQPFYQVLISFRF
ncbi:hypothetical protein [Algoriphagus confluentis]|uniref:DUF481 domain-containing protein n=1 Tax=Algoriphagus confluentis TaxID=1697556 RepID=A0ABQ6PKS3_9BACT|nr:hypothetical protein Aconfl_07800 [Algoriphagus confluentis]